MRKKRVAGVWAIGLAILLLLLAALFTWWVFEKKLDRIDRQIEQKQRS